LLLSFSLFELTAQNISSKLSQDEINTMDAAIKADSNLFKMIGWFGEPVDIYEKYKINIRHADSIWNPDQRTIKKLSDQCTTRRFEMISLIDWFTRDDSFIGEVGISYNHGIH
jgi:hypothetical protein